MSSPRPTPEWQPRAAPSRERPSARRVAAVLLIGYAAFVAGVALWPVPVDSGAAGLLSRIHEVLPWATYRRIEFTANIVFFIPLGWLLSILLDKTRYLVLPIGILTTATIEGMQDLFLQARTASLQDIVANTLGVCIGMVLAVAVPALIREMSRDQTD